ncbi:MAG: acetolactate synthase [Rhodobacterales bacterium RIFCSPHIGHO2_02_FULL_62_130]|nr:MAG: acetolactate synthase [Rhodobacterales bacterium RIFCSPHIGHO2_02_FULL_62_130]OHC57360.1 MAG: acetolactate synthase [Rhodobacterales bacterium RIFCSPHIGHO2_12_FULL_62_75]HCZ01370.1 acetolactate synthase [Rhodobacter sp.]
MVEAEGPQVIAGEDAVVAVPSGQDVRLLEVVLNAPGPDGVAARFRFVAPAIAKDGGEIDFETASADMAHLCQTYALPKLAELGPVPTQIIISFSDRAVPFGEAAPDATQFFEAYRVEGDACIWEAF